MTMNDAREIEKQKNHSEPEILAFYDPRASIIVEPLQ